MVFVTERAKEILLRIRISAEVVESQVALRLRRNPTGRLEIVPDLERPGDVVVEHCGAKVLLVGREEVRRFGRATIDCESVPGGAELIVAPQPPAPDNEN